MKTKHSGTILLFASLLAVGAMTGCSTWEKLDDTEKGAVIGVGGGAALGAAVGGTKGAVLGGVGGGVAGGVLGHEHEKKNK